MGEEGNGAQQVEVGRTRGEEAEGMRAERAGWAHPGCLSDAGPAGGKGCPFCAFRGQDRHLAARQG